MPLIKLLKGACVGKSTFFFKELTPRSRTHELHGQGEKWPKSRQTKSRFKKRKKKKILKRNLCFMCVFYKIQDIINTRQFSLSICRTLLKKFFIEVFWGFSLRPWENHLVVFIKTFPQITTHKVFIKNLSHQQFCEGFCEKVLMKTTKKFSLRDTMKTLREPHENLYS